MALTPGAEQAIRNAAPNRGRLGTNLAEALIGALRTAGQAGDVPTPHVVLMPAVTQVTTAHVVYPAPCLLYAVFINSPVGANDNLVLRCGDGGATPIRVTTQCVQAEVSGTLFLGSTTGIGTNFYVDLRIWAFKQDGTSTPDAGDRPDVTCIIGY